MRYAPTRLKPGHVPLERALSKLGLATRGVARGWIEGGRVKVNGEIRKQPRYPVHLERARIEIDGLAAERAEIRTFLLHKPRGVVTTRVDEKGRATVFSLITRDPGLGLHAVGRLDLATSGLLILTNDTRLSSWLTDPVNRVPRVYRVTVRGEVTAETIMRLEEGAKIDDEWLHAERVTLRKASTRESHLTVELRQGKNREIRKLMQAVGHDVMRLKRVSFGGLELGLIDVGDYRELSSREVASAFPGVLMCKKGD